MISAVIVVYGPSPELAALVTSLKPHGIELIVVVNPAPEEPPIHEDDFDIIIRNEINVGFGQAVNQGALAASGDYLLILNSDVEMPAAWKESLLRPFEDSAVGAVAPVLVDPDGTVQELGSFVGSEGETVAFGRGIAESLFEDFYERPVDYASAACLLVRRDVFHRIGGFHPIYGLGYFEDVELAFVLRTLGLRTQLVPTVRVIHHREASFGTSVANQLMDKNRGIFVDRWAEDLKGRPSLTDFESRPYRLIHARDWHVAERLLVVTDNPIGLVNEINQLHDTQPELLIVLVASSIPEQLSKAVRSFGFDALSELSQGYCFWASMVITQGELPSEVSSFVQTSQELEHCLHIECDASLVEAVSKMQRPGS